MSALLIAAALDGLGQLFDAVLILVTLYLVFNVPWFAGGWGWFLLLGLSPRSRVTRW